MSKFCRQCGAQLEDDAVKCEACGLELQQEPENNQQSVNAEADAHAAAERISVRLIKVVCRGAARRRDEVLR